MRRYQLSGLEHMHMMRNVPRSYDMTRTHIMHKGVNKHVDVVLKCSPKNWKKKKVTVSVVRGDKKNDAARIRANAQKGYVAVRKAASSDQFEAQRRAAATAYETHYGRKSAGSDALIHDMRSQMASMARKSADYIDNQLNPKPVISYTEQPAAANQPSQADKPLISPETERILREGGYRIPGDKSRDVNPYAADYLKHASNEEFHLLMNSLEKSLDEACKKYAVHSEITEAKTESEPDSEPDSQNGSQYFANYTGNYKLPNDVSLSVTQKQEIKAEEKTRDNRPELTGEFKPALTFTDGGEHYLPEDNLFGRELHRPGVFRQEEEEATFFPMESDDEPDGYPQEDYEQQQVYFPDGPDGDQLYNPPEEGGYYADPTMYHESVEAEGYEDGEYEYTEGEDGEYEYAEGEDGEYEYAEGEDGEYEYAEGEDGEYEYAEGEEEEEEAPPMIFPDDEEEDGYSPAPVSPDRNEYYDDDADHQGIMDRSGQTFFSRTGDQIKKVIGIIRGSAGNSARSKKAHAPIQNQNVEISYSDRNRYN